MNRIFHLVLVSALLVGADVAATAELEFHRFEKQATITVAGKPIAEYVWDDPAIRRPYLRHVRTPSGLLVTRNQPPVVGTDIDDHPTFHPGMWLAFGDLNGADFWRNKGTVRQTEIRKTNNSNESGFITKNLYESDGRTICEETCKITIFPDPHGYVVQWDSTFRSPDADFYFGGEEEMGFGLRVASPLAVQRGGEIINAEGARNGKEVWGKQSDWCAYQGTLEGKRVGLLLVPKKTDNLRSWFHARDYGLLVANPFGRHAFTKGEPSKVVVPRGPQGFRLHFDVLVFESASDQPIDLAKTYADMMWRIHAPRR